MKLAIIIAFAIAAPASAADTAPSAPTPSTAQAPASQAVAAKTEEKLICTREIPVGSTIPKRICKTKTQADQDRRTARELSDQMRSNSTGLRPQ